MYGFLLRPKWIGFHLLVVVGVIVMVNLGFWQLDRLDQRQEFNAQVIARIDQPTVALDALLAESADPDDLAWRPVAATGTYLVDEQVVVVNRSQNGRAGDNVVTPLRLADGRVLLVNRGFVPFGVEIPDVPAATVNVQGLARTSQERRTGQLSDPAEGQLSQVQRVDLDRLAQQIPGEMVPIYVDLLASEPAELPGLPEPVIRPDLSDGPHLAYAVQWFIFSAAVVVGWVLAVRWSITKRRSGAGAAPASPEAPHPGATEGGEPSLSAATDAPMSADSRPSTGDAPTTAPR
jgi:surfeit locus 1 family protein